MRRAKQLLPRLVLVGVLIAGTVARVCYAQRAVVFRGDQNTVALMALHISRGEDFPLYFYGQHYMGGIGPYVIAGVFLVAGPSDLAVSAGMVPFSWLWMLALYLLFGRLINRWAGVIAAAAVAFGPPVLVRISVEPWMGYVPTFAYGALILYLGIRLNDADLSSRAERWCLVGMGGLAGLVIWTNPLGLPYLIVGFTLLVRHVVRMRFRRRLLVKLAVACVALLVTASPVIVTGIRHGLGELFGFRPSRLSVVPAALDMTFTRYVPETFCVWTDEAGAVAVLGALPYIVLLGLLLVGFAAAVIARDRAVVRAALVPLLLIAVCVPFYLANPLAAKHNLRYFLTFFPLVVTAFVFPLALRRAWLTWTTLVLLAVLGVGHLVAYARDCSGTNAAWAAGQRAALEHVVAAAEDAGLRYVMADSDDWHALTWTARERVIFVKPWGERYFPHLAGAIADDRAGFLVENNAAGVFRRTFRALGIRAAEVSVAGRTISYDLELPETAFRLVEGPAVALAVGTETIYDTALTDGDEETILGRPYRDDAALIIDLGGVQPIAAIRFTAPNEWDYPTGYALHGSADGIRWSTIQRVERRATAACIYGNRLFYRGLDTALECRFEPTPLRYLILDELRAPAEHVRSWRFTELTVYAESGTRARPDETEVNEIVRGLTEHEADFAFADPWLSAKIAARGPDGPPVLPYYSPRNPETHVSRVVPVREGVAIVVERAHAADVPGLLKEVTLDDVELGTFETPNYVATVIVRAPGGFASFPGLTWNSFTLLGTARVATASWYHERGVVLQQRSQTEKAKRYFERSFETYPGIEANLRVLASSNDKARAMLERLTPAVEARCRLPYGISLVGYTLTPSELAPGETAALTLVWELDGMIPYDYLPVFVHFTDGGTIRFQADHNVQFPLLPRSTVPRCLVLDEHTFTVPADCPEGPLTIQLGALMWGKQNDRLKPHTELRTRDRAVEIGRVEVIREKP